MIFKNNFIVHTNIYTLKVFNDFELMPVSDMVSPGLSHGSKLFKSIVEKKKTGMFLHKRRNGYVLIGCMQLG